MKRPVAVFMYILLVIGVFALPMRLSFKAQAANSELPTPYKTVALKSVSKGQYVTCDIGTKGTDGKYSKMSSCKLKVGAKKAKAYEQFELVPCTDGSFALRTLLGRKYIACDEKIAFVDFIEKKSKFTISESKKGQYIKLKDENKFLTIINDEITTTSSSKAAEKFIIEKKSDNNYTAAQIKLLQSNEWFELDAYRHIGYLDIQYEIGKKKTDSFSKLGYTLMHLKDKRSIIEIHKMQCAIGVKTNTYLNKPVNDVLIVFQGTAGYGDWDAIQDGGANIWGAGNPDSNGMHPGYNAMANLLKSKENEISVSLNNRTITLKDLLDQAKTGKAHITLIGHSMGGAIAQCYAIHLNKDYEINESKITGRTFNSALALSRDVGGFTDWYNMCVSSDTVPNGLVTGSLINYGIHRLGETIWLYDDKPNKNIDAKEFNIALNKHIMDQTISYILDKTTGHHYIPFHEFGSFNNDGESGYQCKICHKNNGTIKHYYRVSNVSLSKSELIYNGSVQRPQLTVRTSNGKNLIHRYYTVNWSNAKSKECGTYTVTITLSGDYNGTKTLKYRIVPGQAAGLAAAGVSKNAIKLKWNSLSGIKYYMVEQSTDGKNWSKVKVVQGTSYIVTNLKAGTKYLFRIKALDGSKKIAGAPSSVLKTQTKTSAPKITFLKSADARKATVKWEKVTGAKSYIIYKSTDNKTWIKVKEGITKTSYTLTGLTGGKIIYVSVQAVNAYGAKSAGSAAKSVTVKKASEGSHKLTDSSFKALYLKATKAAEDWLFIEKGCAYSSRSYYMGTSVYIGAQTDPSISSYAEYVDHKSIDTVAKLKAYLSKFFTKEVYEKSVDKYYRDINGHLYFVGRYGIGWAETFELSKATITEQTSNTASGKVTIKVYYDDNPSGAIYHTKTLKLKYLNNRWVFDKPFYTVLLVTMSQIPYDKYD